MDRNKDVGKVFQERLGDLKDSPSTNLWDAIASEIDQGNKRRVIPFWYYLGTGLILSSLLGLLIWQSWDNNENTKESFTTIEQTQNFDLNSNAESLQVYNEPKESIDTTNTLHNSTNSNIQNSNITSERAPSSSNISTNSKNNTPITKSNSATYNKKTISANKTSLTNTSKLVNQENLTYSAKSYTTLEDIKNALKHKVRTESPEEAKARTLYLSKIQKELEDAISAQHAENEKLYKEQLELEAQTRLAAQQTQKNKKEVVVETTPKTKPAPLTDEERALKRQAATEYKIAFSPYTSLLSYGSLVRGSSIDDRLVNNPREAIGTVGYGVRIDYPLSKKSSLRLGVGTAPLRYRTEDFQISSVNGNINIFQLTAINAQNVNQPGIETTIEAQDFFNQNQVVSIEQDISYIEVPVDYQYRLLNKRVGLSFNSGLSLFVLTNNSVFATADNGDSILIGRQTDLRDLSFALNVGLSGHYNFSKNWRFNAEPAFKYQINPFTNSNNNFRPYYFGMQFGLSYKY